MEDATAPGSVLATGQTTCWDELGRPIPCSQTGQDGELRPGLPWPEPRFEVSGELVRDRLTGLDWLRDANPFEWPLDWKEARQAVAALCVGDHGGWRLPNRRELWSLVSFANSDPALQSGHPFGNVHLGWYWTSTTAARNRAYAWAVQLTGGRVFFEGKERGAFVWPCRGTSPVLAAPSDPAISPSRTSAEGVPTWPRPRFRAMGEVVEDRLTGLQWARRADLTRGGVHWSAALGAVRGLNRDRPGTARWRLPTIRELESLLDAARCDPSLSDGHPFEGVGGGYWSSTTSAFEPDWAMVLHLGRGAIGVGIKRDPRYLVWPVSGP